MASLIDPVLLKVIMPQATEHNVTRFAPALTRTLEHYGITSTLRTAHFLAQVAHESGQLAFTEELASGAAYEGRTDLGNVQLGDGVRFKGRGLIQITGRGNYQAYSHACRQDLLSGDNPSRVATDTALAADVAGWFWEVHKLNALADSDDVVRITRRINGGLNGLAERQTFLALAKTALERAAAAHTTGRAVEHEAPTAIHHIAPAEVTKTEVVSGISACDEVGFTHQATDRTSKTHQLARPLVRQATPEVGNPATKAFPDTQYRNAA